MPVTLSQFLNDEVDVRYKEEFLSASLNTKVGGGIVPTGIHSGYYLSTSGIALSVTVGDGNDGESRAVVTSGDGEYAVTLRRTGNLTLDLTSQASTTVAICLYASYTVGGTTVAEIRAYETFPTDELTPAPERPDLVILGQVVVPAAGIIAGSAITPWQRVPAAGFLLPGQQHELSLIRNPAFSFGDVGGSYTLDTPPWEWTSTDDTELRFLCSNTNIPPILGTDRYQTLESLNAAAVETLELYQYATPPVPWASTSNIGESFVNIYGVFGVNLAATGGTAEIFVEFMNENGEVDADEATISVDISTAPAVFLINDSIQAPLGSDIWISRIGVRFSGVSFPLGEAVDIYYLQAQLFPKEFFGLTDLNQNDFKLLQAALASKLAFFDPSSMQGAGGFDPIPGNAQAMIAEFLSQGTANSHALLRLLRLDRTDEDNTNEGVSLELRGAIQNLQESLVQGGFRDVAALQSIFAAASPFTLFWESQSSLGPGVSHPTLRIYSSNAGEMLLTSNARYDIGSSMWNVDLAGADAQCIRMTYTQGVRIQKRISGDGDTWADAAWRTMWEMGDDAAGPGGLLKSLAEGFATTDAERDFPRLLTEGSNTSFTNKRLCLWEFGDDSGTNPRVRLYFTQFDDGETAGGLTPISGQYAFEITNNAFWDNSTLLWAKDGDGNFASKLALSRNHIAIYQREIGAGTWADAAWDSAPLMMRDFSEASPSPGLNFHAVNNVTPSAPDPNTLYAESIPVAWGRARLDSGVVAFTDATNPSRAFNVSSITIVNGGNGVRFTLHEPLGGPSPGGLYNGAAVGSYDFFGSSSTAVIGTGGTYVDILNVQLNIGAGPGSDEVTTPDFNSTTGVVYMILFGYQDN